MNDVNERTIQALREFSALLENGVPLKVYMVRRIETPDGPMHVQEPVTLAPYCRLCGEDAGDCDCGLTRGAE